MYRYNHRGQEIWNGNTFESIATQTDDNGARYALKAKHDPNGVSVVREVAPPPRSRATIRDFQQAGPKQVTMPASTLPTTHWNLNQVKQSAVLNSQNGDLAKVQITQGPETIKTTSGKTLEANRYSYSGDVQMDQWFDDRGRW